MPQKREIIYPFFLECCQFCDDSFWETVFEDLAYGKCPYGTYISKGFICCSYKNKEFSYKIERKDPKILYEDLYKLLKDRLGILSQKEKNQKRLVFNQLEKNIRQSRKDWASIRRKNIKDIMYEKYVIDMKNKYNLSNKQCKFLLSTILISIMFKTISPKDIEFKDDKIQNIAGIEFENEKVIYKKPLCTIENNLKGSVSVSPDTVLDEDEENDKIMSKNWTKFLDVLKSNN